MITPIPFFILGLLSKNSQNDERSAVCRLEMGKATIGLVVTLYAFFHYQSNDFLKRSTATVKTPNAITAKASICGHSTSKPTPLRKVARMITR